MTLLAKSKKLKGGALTAISLLTLLLSAGLFHWLPTRDFATALRPNVDLLLIVALAIAWPQLPKQSLSIRRWILRALTLLLGLAILLGIAQTVAMREFGYDFMFAYHMDKVTALFSMMYDAQSFALFSFYIVLLLLVVSLVLFACHRALRQLFNFAMRDRHSQRNIALSVSAYTLCMGLVVGFNSSMSVELGDQIAERIYREERMAERAAEIEKHLTTLPKVELGENIKRPTILVFVVESYGQILLETSKYESWHKSLSGMEQSLSDTGYHMRSKVYRAPVFGGSSWLANATILCRYLVASEKTFKSLFKSKTKCLPSHFNDAGYQSVFAASNTTKIVPEYAALFPFDKFYPRDELGYKGPRISWSYMPDQYVIDVIERQVLSQPSEDPHFIYYKLTSSHHPWDTIPPYIENWDSIGDGSVYDSVKMLRYPGNEFLGGKFYNEGYLSSILYSMQTVVGYLNQLPKDREVLAVVLGDHQPRKPVADIADDPWTIPLHVLSRDKELIERFSHDGYSPGLFTETKTGSPGLEHIAAHLFGALNDVHSLQRKIDQKEGR